MLNNLTKYWRNYLFGIMSILLVVAGFTAAHYYRIAQDAKQLANGIRILKDPTVKIDTFIDHRGLHHAEFNANTNKIPRAALKDSTVKRDSIIQKIDRDLNLADADHLLEVTQENLQLRAAVLRLKKDSANTALLAYSDKSISFTYDPRDSTLRDLLINLHLNQVKYAKHKFFSNTPVYDFYGDDPRVTFSGFSHFTVSVPPPLFGLTADAKAMYFFATGRMAPSVGLNLRIANFFLEGRNYYSFKNDRFQQMAAFGYRQTIF